MTNIKASNKTPSVYLSKLRERNSKLADAVGQQLIPKEVIDGTYDLFYDEFLKDRGNAIMAVLKKRVIDVRSRLLEKDGSLV